MTLVATPYVTKQVNEALDHILRKPYIQTAVAKGLSTRQVFISHVLPNASLPLITLFFSYLAYAFGGAFVVEMVFGIEGVGKLMVESVRGDDIPVIAAIILYLIVIKMLLGILADVVSFLVNPSVKF